MLLIPFIAFLISVIVVLICKAYIFKIVSSSFSQFLNIVFSRVAGLHFARNERCPGTRDFQYSNRKSLRQSRVCWLLCLLKHGKDTSNIYFYHLSFFFFFSCCLSFMESCVLVQLVSFHYVLDKVFSRLLIKIIWRLVCGYPSQQRISVCLRQKCKAVITPVRLIL